MRTLLNGHPAHCPTVFLTPPSCQLVYVGWNFTVPEQLRDYSVKGAFSAPTRLHIGERTRRCLLHSCIQVDWTQGAVWLLCRLLIHPCPHLCAGNIGLAPAIGVTATSAVPMRTGGNFDQRRLGKGATLYLPVEVRARAPARAAACRCALPRDAAAVTSAALRPTRL